MRIETV